MEVRKEGAIFAAPSGQKVIYSLLIRRCPWVSCLSVIVSHFPLSF